MSLPVPCEGDWTAELLARVREAIAWSRSEEAKFSGQFSDDTGRGRGYLVGYDSEAGYRRPIAWVMWWPV